MFAVTMVQLDYAVHRTILLLLGMEVLHMVGDMVRAMVRDMVISEALVDRIHRMQANDNEAIDL